MWSLVAFVVGGWVGYRRSVHEMFDAAFQDVNDKLAMVVFLIPLIGGLTLVAVDLPVLGWFLIGYFSGFGAKARSGWDNP